MHPEGSLPCLQGPTTCSCPKPDESKLHPACSCNNRLNIVLPTTTTSSSGLLSRDFRTKTPIHATFPAHFTLDLVTLTISVMSINHTAFRYADFSGHVLCPPT